MIEPQNSRSGIANVHKTLAGYFTNLVLSLRMIEPVMTKVAAAARFKAWICCAAAELPQPPLFVSVRGALASVKERGADGSAKTSRRDVEA